MNVDDITDPEHRQLAEAIEGVSKQVAGVPAVVRQAVADHEASVPHSGISPQVATESIKTLGAHSDQIAAQAKVIEDHSKILREVVDLFEGPERMDLDGTRHRKREAGLKYLMEQATLGRGTKVRLSKPAWATVGTIGVAQAVTLLRELGFFG